MRSPVKLLTLSAIGLVGLVAHEGYTDRAIRPLPTDVPTVGFGSTRRADGTPVQMGDAVTPPVALARALRDVQQFEGAIKLCITAPLYQHEYDAYLGFSYNVGSDKFCSSTMSRLINAEKYAEACAEFDKWTYFQGKDCRVRANKCYGLVERRVAERARCEGR